MAKTSSIELTIQVDDKNVKQNLEAISRSVKQLGLVTESTFAKQNMGVLGVKSFAGVKEEMAKLTTAYRDLATSGKASSGEQAKALEALRSKQRELYATISTPPKLDAARGTLGVSSHQAIVAEIAKVRLAYATLASSGKLSMAELAQAKVAMGAKIDELRAKTNNWRDALGQIKGKAVEAAAAVGAMVLVSKAAIDFESAMADVRKVVDGSPEEIATLGDELLKLSRTVPLTAVELAKIAASGGQLGIAAGEILPFVEVTAKMATAFDMTAEEAGTAIGKLKNVFQLSIPEIANFGDSINQLGNTTAAREKDIVDVMLRVGGTSRQFGLAKEQTAALAAAMLSLGKAPEVAATSINSLLNRMQTATMQSGDFQAALGKIGTSAEEMADSVAKDPQKAIETLLNTLAKLDGREKAEVLTGLFGREFQDDIAVLVGGLQTYKDALQQVADKTVYAGAMQKEFEVRSATTANKLKTVGNVIWEIGNNIGEGFLPAIKAAGDLTKALLTPIADLTAAFPKLSAGIVAVGASALVFSTASKAVGILKMATAGFGTTATGALGGVGAAVVGVGGKVAMLAGRVSLLGGVFVASYALAKAASDALRDRIVGITAAQNELERNTAKTAEGFKEVSKSTGITITSMKQLDQEVKAGKIHYDELTGTWVKGAKEQAAATESTASGMKAVTGEALKAMQKQYQDYANQIKVIQEAITGRQRSLYAELRDMARTGMSDVSAWKDQKREAEEYAAAAKKAAEAAHSALNAGDSITAESKFSEAVGYADKAKDAYKSLNTEVKDGERVAISQQQALKTSMQGVEDAGNLGIKIMKEQQAAAKDAQDALKMKSGFANLTEGMDEAEKTWLKNWETMQSFADDQIVHVAQKLDELTKPRWVTVWVTEKGTETVRGTYRLGGKIQALAAGGGVRNVLAGGHLPGFGGGDRRQLLGEDGEVMIRKESVKAGGLRAALAFNAGRWDIVIEELNKRMRSGFSDRIGYMLGGLLGDIPAQALAGGGLVAGSGSTETMTIDLNFGPGRSVPVMATKTDAARIKKEFDRMHRMRSGN